MGTTIMDSYTPSRSQIHARAKKHHSLRVKPAYNNGYGGPLLKSTKRSPCMPSPVSESL